MYTEQHQLAIKLNEQGATLIENGQYEEAVPVFTNALRIFQQTVMECHDDFDHAISLDHCMKQSLRPPSHAEVGDFIYESLLRVMDGKRSVCTCAGATWQQTAATVSAIAIFNFALSCHLGAVKMFSSSPQTQSKMLNYARILYELAYKLHGDIDEANFRFMFAVVNNLGHVLKCLDEPLLATRRFEQLLSILMFVVVCSVGSKDVLLGEMDGYLRNTSHLVLSDSTAAAA
jgi:hypothetical protein